MLNAHAPCQSGEISLKLGRALNLRVVSTTDQMPYLELSSNGKRITLSRHQWQLVRENNGRIVAAFQILDNTTVFTAAPFSSGSNSNDADNTDTTVSVEMT